jgi:hypothetical protein
MFQLARATRALEQFLKQLEETTIIPVDTRSGSSPPNNSSDAQGLARKPIGHKWRRRLTIVAVVALAAWVFRAPILCGLAGGLIVEDRLVQEGFGPAPAVLILDGDRQFDSAARLYSAGGARTILVSSSPPDRLVRLGIMPRGEETAGRELLKRGVAKQDFVIIAGESDSRSRIAAALAAWLAEHPDQSVNVLCERFTSRAWKLVLRRAAGPPLKQHIRIVALPNRHYDETNWWRSKPGTMAFLTNYIILGFHCWRSGDEPDDVERTNAEFRAAFTKVRE